MSCCQSVYYSVKVHLNTCVFLERTFLQSNKSFLVISHIVHYFAPLKYGLQHLNECALLCYATQRTLEGESRNFDTSSVRQFQAQESSSRREEGESALFMAVIYEEATKIPPSGLNKPSAPVYWPLAGAGAKFAQYKRRRQK